MGGLVTRRGTMIGAVASAAAFIFAPKSALAKDAKVHVVRIKSFAFQPSRLRVRVGDVIRWTNEDLAPHTATANEFGWDTGELARGDTGEVIVTADMEREYFCVFHPHMKGRIKIL